MEPESVTASAEELAAENAELRRAVDELHAQLAEQAARTNEVVARAQERAYWLDRWHVDLNSVMRVPGAAAARAVFRAIRAPYRQLVDAWRSWRQ